jgi:hypothetical protein
MLSTPNLSPTNSSLPSNLELGLRFHLQILPATTGGSSPSLLKMLRSIFIACKASKEVIIKRQEVILRN